LISKTENLDLVRSIIIHPKIYPHVSDDGSPSPEDFIAPPNVTYCLIHEGEDIGGVYIIVPVNFICCDIHTCILPHWWGEKAKKSILDFVEWIFKETAYEKIISWIPDNNQRALKFALQAGFKVEGLNTKSYKKDGILYDQIMVGLTK
jgi:RimJ/RimL family protein N-acetyltransferase